MDGQNFRKNSFYASFGLFLDVNDLFTKMIDKKFIHAKIEFSKGLYKVSIGN
jgi:hypothetical protein